MTITEFLLARITEDEVLARAADASRWRGEDKGITFDMYGDRYDDGEAMARLEADTHANADLIVEFSPPRVLAECAAKRAIVERHSECGTGFGYCDDGGHGWGMGDEPLGCGNLGDLAAVYAYHPDYDTAWRV